MSYGTGPNFPLNWSPRYAIAAGFGAHPDMREDYQVRESPRVPTVTGPGDYGAIANSDESPDGFVVNGTLPTNERQGIHSLTDVMVYAMGPCQEIFGGTYDNTDVFYKMATCFGLGQPKRSCVPRPSSS